MVKLGTTEAQRKLFFKLRQEQERLLAQGFEATPKLLAERLNVTEQDVVEMDQRLGPRRAVARRAGGRRRRRPPAADRLPSVGGCRRPRSGWPTRSSSSSSGRSSPSSRKTLEGKERYIFEKRLTADEPLTLQDIGDHYGVSRERARQIEAALINRMREYMREQIPDFDLVAEPKN